MQRNNKGSVVTWLLLIAIIGLTIVFGVISLELLIRWVSLGRIQNATKQAALTYARDMIRLKDNKLSSFSGASKNNLTFQQAGIHCSPPTDQSGCSALVGSKSSIPSSAPYTEYLHASQVLLYNVWGTRISDSAEVDDVRQKQCYKPHEQTRFSLNKSAPENTCVSNNKITSPIMSLEWQFSADPYGFGVCCSSGNPTGKDFCATANVKGRMDPIMAGGLPFLHSIDFIRIGEFNISERVVVPSMNAANSNVDGMFFEPSNTGPCPLAPPPAILPPVGNTPAIIIPSPGPNPIPTNSSSGNSFEPPVTPDPSTPPVGPGTTPPFNPDCPSGYKLSTINKQDKNYLDYTCNPCPARGGLVNSFCSGNDVASNFHDGNCGSYQQTTQSCSNGCSNATCSPPPPPPPENGCVYKIQRYYNHQLAGTTYETLLGSTNANSLKALIEGTKARLIKEGRITAISKSTGNWGYALSAQFLKNLGFFSEQDLQAWDEIIKNAGGGFNEGGTGINWTRDNKATRESTDCAIKATRNFSNMNAAYLECQSKLAYYLDEQGNVIGQGDSKGRPICGAIGTASPISLIFSNEPERISASQFKLGDKAGWYQWKASSNRPLLVYDPKHTGQITSPTQLFGNYTFGKNWTNGYEALSTLDKNLDEKLAGKELKDLALWFDNNQNGISEKGEVKKLAEVGITKLFFKPNTTNLENGDITANIGYERCHKVTTPPFTKGTGGYQCVIGSSVDWFGAGPFDTKQEAILNKQFVAGLGFTQTSKYFVGRN
jgi:hypothetical protein